MQRWVQAAMRFLVSMVFACIAMAVFCWLANKGAISWAWFEPLAGLAAGSVLVLTVLGD